MAVLEQETKRPRGRRREYTDAEREEFRRQKQERAQGILDEVVGMFKSGELPELVAQTTIARLEGAPIGRWSILNQLCAIRAGTTDARGFRQWQEAGRQVRKGCHAFYILGPKTIREEKDDGTKEVRVIGFVPIPVFRVQDTDGDELEELYRPAVLPPLFDVAGRLGVRVDYIPGHAAAGFRGFYRPGSREIALCTEDVRTFFHELAHAAHHKTLQAAGRPIESVDDVELEVVAETVAATLCHLYGYDGYLWYGAKYVERHAKENPGRAAAHYLGEIQKTLGVIVDEAAACELEAAV